MAVILPSRFAVLKVEGDEPDETKTAKKPAKTGSNSDKNSQAAKPKPKKKKKPAEKDGQVFRSPAQPGQLPFRPGPAHDLLFISNSRPGPTRPDANFHGPAEAHSCFAPYE
ncbi:hypothetical protein HPB47_028366 [Ixodes persulcatus]|uniref:Uncharacterized protein n=1 Tax=Ixodes persulcatus TaxID=34615 RepID=A0AC60PV67_IXOPE|nr:hypothetical protein HPB47_028366 [Ixodes persulcatus]